MYYNIIYYNTYLASFSTVNGASTAIDGVDNEVMTFHALEAQNTLPRLLNLQLCLLQRQIVRYHKPAAIHSKTHGLRYLNRNPMFGGCRSRLNYRSYSSNDTNGGGLQSTGTRGSVFYASIEIVRRFPTACFLLHVIATYRRARQYSTSYVSS